MATEAGSNKCETRSGCKRIEFASAFHVLQQFRDKIKTEDLVEPDDSNLESVESDIDIDKGALAQLDGSAMLPPTKQMVLDAEYNVLPVSVPTASGSATKLKKIRIPGTLANGYKVALSRA
ncbi:hypothetical protein PAXRUDRAFT_824838 [Paxillus rubicundulus Ve08.2h10]|uniref:Uncharacterized protein n=1 Tax=Paxillus rubicundulus Ve08.2h10 TaxID=930991 RepID=A0A0D0E7A9_9AGAM|nr:hypothetical protein PAXRUDRAFT_824838 [Paxillus rubicundulus Ve08.2h10]